MAGCCAAQRGVHRLLEGSKGDPCLTGSSCRKKNAHKGPSGETDLLQHCLNTCHSLQGVKKGFLAARFLFHLPIRNHSGWRSINLCHGRNQIYPWTETPEARLNRKVQPVGETLANLLLERDLTVSLPHPQCCYFCTRWVETVNRRSS